MFLEPDEIDPIPAYDPMTVGAGASPWSSGEAEATGEPMPAPFMGIEDEWGADESPPSLMRSEEAGASGSLDTFRPFRPTRRAG